MKKFILTTITLLLIVFISILYGNKTKNKDSIVVSEVTHSVFYAPWYVAIENGYFKSQGLNIEVQLIPGADKVATSVLSDDADIGFSGPEATIYVYNNSHEKLLTFASLTKRDGQFIVGDCSLKDTFTMNDLKGKSILAGRTGGMPLMMFNYALKESNIESDLVDINTSVDFASLSGAYISHQADFVNLFEPNATNIEKQKYGCVLASLGQITGIVPYTTFYAKEEYINNNKETIKKFNIALNEGLKFVHNNDPKTIAKSILNQFPDTSLNDLTILVERYKNADSWYNTTYVDKKDYERLIDILIYNKSIKKKINAETLLTNEFN